MTTTDTPVRRAAVGALIGSAWLAGLFAVGPLVGGFAVVGLAEAIIDSTPGWLSSTMIGLLGFWAQPVLLATVLVGLVAVTAAVGVLGPKLPDLPPALLILVGLVATALLFASIGVDPSLTGIVGLVLAIGPPYVVGRLLVSNAEMTDADRRSFLDRTAAVVVGGAASILALRIALEQVTEPRTTVAGRELPYPVDPPTGDPEFDFGAMPAAVTLPDEHYVIDINFNPPSIDLDSWTLDIDGAVIESYTLSYDELIDHDRTVEQTTTMLCISNPVGGDLIGTAHWSGVQLSDLVDAAEPDESAVDVVTHAADGYSEAFPIEQVRREDILLAYGMGDRRLTAAHGFPVRLLFPGRYGMKMTKWITRIEITTTEHSAFWEERGWNETATVNTASYIRAIERDGDRVLVGGVAFGGLETGVKEITGVEVSVDGGDTWNDATLEPMIAPHAWRRWRYEFETPERQTFEFICRAIKGDDVQTSVESEPRPDGATGWHRRTEGI